MTESAILELARQIGRLADAVAQMPRSITHYPADYRSSGGNGGGRGGYPPNAGGGGPSRGAGFASSELGDGQP